MELVRPPRGKRLRLGEDLQEKHLPLVKKTGRTACKGGPAERRGAKKKKKKGGGGG